MPVGAKEFRIDLILDPAEAAVGPVAAPATTSGAAWERWSDATGHDYGYTAVDQWGYRLGIYGVGCFSFAHHSGRVEGAPEPGVSHERLQDVFRRQVVPLVLQQHSREVLHGSGLVVAGRWVALSGNPEMGKSTLAHAWRRRAGHIFADDAIPFRSEQGAICVRPIPFRIRLRPPALRHFGLAGAEAGRIWEATSGTPEADGGVLRAVYFLDRRDGDDGPISLAAVAPAEALPALLQQAFWLTLNNPTRNRQMAGNYLDLLAAVPIFRLSYPTGLAHVDPILDQLASHVASLPDR